MSTVPKPFYYQLDGTIIGPVTGIDLRDAALAGNVAPTTLVANDPNGEWIAAIRIRGLFNESGEPLPHPPETQQHLASASSPQTSGPLEASARSECEPEQSRGREEWYVQISDRQIGPLTIEQLAHMSANGRLREDDMVRLGKEGRWAKANQVRTLGFTSFPPPLPTTQAAVRQPLESYHGGVSGKELKKSPPTAPPFVAHLSDEPTAESEDRLVTNRCLPTMANWICVYCIAVSPSLWVIDVATNLATGFQDPNDVFFVVLFTAISTLVTVMLFIGGLCLRNLRPSGPRFIKAGLWTSLATFVLAIPIMLLVTAVAVEAPAFMNLFDVILCLMLPVYVVAMVFHVASLVWLTKNTKTLPLVKT